MKLKKHKKGSVFYETQGSKKIWNYYKQLVHDRDFIHEVKLIRKKFGIPTNEVGTDYHPEITKRGLKDLLEESRTLGNKFELFDEFWITSIVKYILYNLLERPKYTDLCYIEPNLDVDYENPDIDNVDIMYPITIKISHRASERDILDFVKKYYMTIISPLQYTWGKKNGSTNLLGKIRTRNDYIAERNRFIYMSKDLPYKEIARLVMKKYGPGSSIDVGSIGKIISNLNKSRQEM